MIKRKFRNNATFTRPKFVCPTRARIHRINIIDNRAPSTSVKLNEDRVFRSRNFFEKDSDLYTCQTDFGGYSKSLQRLGKHSSIGRNKLIKSSRPN